MPVWRFRNTSIIYPKYKLLEGILAARGLNADELSGASRLDPYQVPGMEQVARRIAQAASNKEKVLIFGDYDCDGICSTLIMMRFLERCGALAAFHLPSRQDEGYGIRPDHVERAVDEGFDLIVTVDNGISAFQAAETAQVLGIDLVITDHHEPQDKIPEAPVVDPKLPGSSCYREYSGAGVAYLTCCAVAQLLGRPEPEDFLDLVSLATVVDVCPLTGDNFVLARRGLLQMRSSLRPGLQALFNCNNQYQITGRTMGWILGPHINAAGRFGDPLLAYNLLSAKTPEEAEPLAAELKKVNTERKNAVEVIKQECLSMYDGSYFPLLASPDWHEGIVGIAAGRLVDAVSRPAAVGAICGEEARFSARSLGKFDLVEALSECQSQTGALLRFGGHKLAAGFSLNSNNIPEVRGFLNKFAQECLQPEDKVHWIEVDASLAAVPPPSEVASLDYLEPHGKDNPEPTFYINDRAVDVKSGTGWTLVRLNSGLKYFTSQPVQAGDRVHTVLSLAVDEYNGFQNIIGNARDVRPFLCSRNNLLQQYLKWRRGEEITELAEKIFHELDLERTGDNNKTNLFLSPTFLRFGIVKEGRKR
jgi:single-stranded-DNA-specific exonuclease